MTVQGRIVWVSGPAVKADGMAAAKMYETVMVGDSKLIGEVIRLTGDIAFIQVYESTSGLTPGEPVVGTGNPLSVLLGSGIIGQLYDGIQRPLRELSKKSGSFIGRGIETSAVDMAKKHHFMPAVSVGDSVTAGSVLGTVRETELLDHSIMVPPNSPGGKVADIAKEGDYDIETEIATLEHNGAKTQLKMYHRWPVRTPRRPRPRMPRRRADTRTRAGHRQTGRRVRCGATQRVTPTMLAVAVRGDATESLQATLLDPLRPSGQW